MKTDEQKESINDVIFKEQEETKILVDKLILNHKKTENEYDRYFSQILEYSKDFKLTKTKKTLKKEIKYRDENGKLITVGHIEKEYNDCAISYVGKLPDSVTYNPFRISVEEHTVYSREYWTARYEGIKICVEIYGGITYYKTAKGFVKRINEELKLIWDNHNANLINDFKLKLAISAVSEKFGECTVLTSDFSKITIALKNGITVSLGYITNLETRQVNFNFRNLLFGSVIKKEHNVIDLIRFCSNL